MVGYGARSKDACAWEARYVRLPAATSEGNSIDSAICDTRAAIGHTPRTELGTGLVRGVVATGWNTEFEVLEVGEDNA